MTEKEIKKDFCCTELVILASNKIDIEVQKDLEKTKDKNLDSLKEFIIDVYT